MISCSTAGVTVTVPGYPGTPAYPGIMIAAFLFCSKLSRYRTITGTDDHDFRVMRFTRSGSLKPDFTVTAPAGSRVLASSSTTQAPKHVGLGNPLELDDLHCQWQWSLPIFKYWPGNAYRRRPSGVVHWHLHSYRG
eukprot:886178-Rhodomonas_salina.5